MSISSNKQRFKAHKHVNLQKKEMSAGINLLIESTSDIDLKEIAKKVKSGIRILACWRLYEGDLQQAAGYLILAEGLGIVEEIL